MHRLIGLVVMAIGLSLGSCEPPEIEPRKFSVDVFPNPFFDLVQINAFSLPPDEIVSIRFVNEEDEPFIEIDEVRSGDFFSVNLSEEPSGLYFLEIDNGSETEVVQVIKGERE
ncbi:MAG: T9SS type A sorting domain-containing protein [Bacteroidota bacterium]